jgi:Tfp pilus assembly protein PilO
MRSVSKRERTLIAVCAGVALFIGLPALLAPPPKSGKVGTLADEKKKHHEVLDQIADARAEIETLEKKIQGRISAEPPAKLVGRMVHAAQLAAKKSGLKVDDLKPLPAESASGLKRVPLEITATGRFPQAARFVFELEQAAGKCRIDQLQMSATDPRTNALALEIRMVGYVKPQEGEDESSAL